MKHKACTRTDCLNPPTSRPQHAQVKQSAESTTGLEISQIVQAIASLQEAQRQDVSPEEGQQDTCAEKGKSSCLCGRQ